MPARVVSPPMVDRWNENAGVQRCSQRSASLPFSVYTRLHILRLQKRLPREEQPEKSGNRFLWGGPELKASETQCCPLCTDGLRAFSVASAGAMFCAAVTGVGINA